MEEKYVKKLYRTYGATEKEQAVFENIRTSPTVQREEILKNVALLRKQVGLHFALLALYRQQVNSGFVLHDPLISDNEREKTFYDENTGITFKALWNPHREMRKNHALLLERGIVRNRIDESKFVNIASNGVPCYLCKNNIALQNPGEIVISLKLENEDWCAGANFAYITNNHFTVMNAQHRLQLYRKEIPALMVDLLDQSDGIFRIIYNGTAGASIPWHEHFQITTEQFPIEAIAVPEEMVFTENQITVTELQYYLPLWLVEGTTRNEVTNAVHRVLTAWHLLDEHEAEKNYTENIIAVKSEDTYRFFIFLRDKRLTTSPTKIGEMASFETGGMLVFSHEPKEPSTSDINEKAIFDKLNLEMIKEMLIHIAPDDEQISQLRQNISYDK